MTLETAGTYGKPIPTARVMLMLFTYKDVLRHAAKHDLVMTENVEEDMGTPIRKISFAQRIL
jgi:hypothetical protein